MSPAPSRRGEAVGPFHVMALLERARAMEAAGRDIVHMEIGEPDFPAPEAVITAARAALDAGLTHYTPATGLPALRTAIAAYYGKTHGIALDASRVVVTPGSSGALQLALAALLDPGDEVLLTDPGYPCNRHIASVLGIRSIALPVTSENDCVPTITQLEAAATPRTKALLLASPSNPTGGVIRHSQLKAIADWARQRSVTLVMDEIYHGLVYAGGAMCALAVSDDAIVINSFSKYFGMTGFRVGWLVAPARLVPVIDRLAQNLFLAAGTVAQHAALAALHPDTITLLDTRRDEFRARRDFLLPAIQELGFAVPVEPEGAFYIYADASRFTGDSLLFAERMLEKTGVVITPGVDFGSNGADTHVRFAYTTTIARMKEGITRLRTALPQPR